MLRYAGTVSTRRQFDGVSGERSGQLGNAAFLDNAGCKHSCVNSQSRDINSLSVSISTVKLKKKKNIHFTVTHQLNHHIVTGLLPRDRCFSKWLKISDLFDGSCSVVPR